MGSNCLCSLPKYMIFWWGLWYALPSFIATLQPQLPNLQNVVKYVHSQYKGDACVQMWRGNCKPLLSYKSVTLTCLWSEHTYFAPTLLVGEQFVPANMTMKHDKIKQILKSYKFIICITKEMISQSRTEKESANYCHKHQIKCYQTNIYINRNNS